MRRILGDGWDPVERLLLWSLSERMDDFTDVPELQDPGFNEMRQAWPPIFEVDFQRKDGRCSLRRVGSRGYGLLSTGDEPLRVTLEALDYSPDLPREQWGPAEVEYVVARYR